MSKNNGWILLWVARTKSAAEDVTLTVDGMRIRSILGATTSDSSWCLDESVEAWRQHCYERLGKEIAYKLIRRSSISLGHLCRFALVQSNDMIQQLTAAASDRLDPRSHTDRRRLPETRPWLLHNPIPRWVPRDVEVAGPYDERARTRRSSAAIES
jgi:hypothetical protein